MSTNIVEQLVEDQQITNIRSSAATENTARNLFTHQTGQVLVTLGTLFKYIPPFNESIDQSTGDTLITLGKKLKSVK